MTEHGRKGKWSIYLCELYRVLEQRKRKLLKVVFRQHAVNSYDKGMKWCPTLINKVPLRGRVLQNFVVAERLSASCRVYDQVPRLHPRCGPVSTAKD
jgi:hypothetical protein